MFAGSMGTRTTLRAFGALAGVCVLLVAAAAAPAPPVSRADCEAAHPASRGRAGKDVIWLPTPDEVVHAMLTMAKVAPEDLVVDLGAGDGRIAIAAAKEFGARSVGIEYDPEMATLAGCLVEAEGLGARARIVQGDIFKEDFSQASVVTMYLLPELNVCVRHRILELAPGTRVASHQFGMGEWEADETADVQYRNVYLWVVPARVDGLWDFRAGQGETFTVDLTQSFGTIGGEIVQGVSRRPLLAATLRGTDLRLSFEDASGATRSFTGTVRGGEIAGVLRDDAGGEVQARGALRGALRPAPWAEAKALCRRYYDR
jgi:SAM-dependent methyltransferase